MIRRTVFGVAALVAFAVALTAWAADDSFFFVVDDEAASIDGYSWLDPLPPEFADEAARLIETGETATEMSRLSSPERRFIVFQSRSCPPLIEITTATHGSVEVIARDPRVDWRCGGYQHTYVLELRFRPDAAAGPLTVSDAQTSQSVARP